MPGGAFKTGIEPAWLWRIAQATQAVGLPCVANKALKRCSVVVRFANAGIVFRRPCLEIIDHILGKQERA